MAKGHYGAAMTESRDQNKFVVRLPDGMRERIAEVAKANNRSMNAEIISRLEYSFKAVSAAPVVEFLNDMAENYKVMSIDILQANSYTKMLEAYLELIDPGGPRPARPKPLMGDSFYKEISADLKIKRDQISKDSLKKGNLED